MSPAGKKGVLIGGVVVMVAIVTAAVVILSGGDPVTNASATVQDTATEPAVPIAPSPKSAAQQYLAALAAGDADGAGQFTDDPTASITALRDAWHTLQPSEVQTKLGKVGAASAAYTLTWTLDPVHVWSYSGTFDLVQTSGDWRVHWTPAVLQPTLRAGQHLALLTATPRYTAVVDRDGKPLVTAGPGGKQVTDDFSLLRSALSVQAGAAAPDVFAVERVDAKGHDLQTLYGKAGSHVQPVRTTLSLAMQTAAQSVVDAYSGAATIVAIRPSDGGLLAVAQNPRDVGGSPFSGLYAPGSTFKIATATAALEAGIATKDSELACPLTAHIGTRTISNEGFDLGTTTMHRAFARSCNTTFGKLASELPRDGLAKAASQYGLNADFDIPGLETQTGKVVPAAGSDEQVEDGIGQGTVQVTPFGEALMAATVAAGHPVTPRLWQDVATKVDTGYTAPPASVLASLRTMMREVVTNGTATGLANSGTVYGKTGTAQFGSGAQANGWFTGYRGNIAFAVFLAGANDSRPAVTLGATFLAALK